MKRTTIWKPDTCKCVIEYEWDDALNEDTRIHEVKNILERCEAHQLTLDEEVFITVEEENRRKNKTIDLIYQNGGKKVLTPTEKEQVRFFMKASGNDGEVPDEIWEPSVKYNSSFDKNRKLIISVEGLNVAKKNIIRNKLSLMEDSSSIKNRKLLKKDKVEII